MAFRHRFLYISTDEVFGSLGAEGLFTQETVYAGSKMCWPSRASSATELGNSTSISSTA
jgi:dTDP-glucose 4,6-dehydratase